MSSVVHEREERFKWSEVKRGIFNIQVWLSATAYFGILSGLYSFGLFVSRMTQPTDWMILLTMNVLTASDHRQRDGNHLQLEPDPAVERHPLRSGYTRHRYVYQKPRQA